MYLSAKTIENAKGKAKLYRLFDGDGLYLEVTPEGRRYWRFKYAFEGRERRIAFGVFPEVSLVEAREKREAARKQVASGIDPAAERKERRRFSHLPCENNFEAITREWHALNKDRWDAKYEVYVLHRMEKDIFPHIGKLPIASIRPLQLLDALRLIEERGAGEIARRTLYCCSQVFLRIHQLYKTPRGPLTRRFGPELIQRLDQALGRQPEPLVLIQAPEMPCVRRNFAEPVANPAYIERVLESLADELCKKLESKGLGARKLDLVFQRVDNTAQSISETY